LDARDSTFQKDKPDAQPILTIHRQGPTRCAHAYLLTSCSAKAMIETLKKHKSSVDTPDWLMHFIIPRSPIIQAFWLDPPLIYQGNRIIDVEQLPTFRGATYDKTF
jgi:hypothetical protein